MQLASQFQDGAAIPRRYACDGQNHSPPLNWTAPPQQTQSFVLLCDDPDAAGGTWHHWAVYDIPAGQRSLAEHHPRHGAGVRQGLNDFHQPGYDGPCPPPGDKPHHYHFRLLALATGLFLCGNEIRVRAEERLLASRFGAAFLAYRRRAPALIPFSKLPLRAQ